MTPPLGNDYQYVKSKGESKKIGYCWKAYESLRAGEDGSSTAVKSQTSSNSKQEVLAR